MSPTTNFWRSSLCGREEYFSVSVAIPIGVVDSTVMGYDFWPSPQTERDMSQSASLVSPAPIIIIRGEFSN